MVRYWYEIINIPVDLSISTEKIYRTRAIELLAKDGDYKLIQQSISEDCKYEFLLVQRSAPSKPEEKV